jgi:hypothetical protein
MTENNEMQIVNPNPETTQLAGLLIGGGVLSAIYLLIKKNRRLISWIVPVGLIVGGLDMLLNEQRARVQLTGDQIIAQLDELDPITKAEVIKYVADQEISRFKK